MMKRKGLNHLKDSWKYLIVLFFSAVVIVPIFIVLFTSFKTSFEYDTKGILELPSSLYLGNYKKAFLEGSLMLAFRNSFILVLFGAAGSIILGSMTAYVLSRFEFTLKKLLKAAFLATALIPSITFAIPIYLMFVTLGVTNTFIAPIFIYLGTDILQLWIYMQHLDKISFCLDESAMVEGASYFKIYRSIIFPILKPATVTIVIIKAVYIYNDYFNQFLYMSSRHLRTITTALQNFESGPYAVLYNVMSAALIIAFIPTIIAFAVLQKYIYSGITMGALKE